MNNKCHYETLGVPKDAPLNDIKKAFRELSMQTHPDVAKDKTQGERFKQIAEAYRILSNTTERGLYDMDVASRYFGNRSNNSGMSAAAAGGDMRGGPRYGPKPPHHHGGLHGFLDRLFHPRVFVLSLTFSIATIYFVRSYIQQDPERDRIRRHHGGSAMVEAWKNPVTGQWELPAPWDPAYRSLKPTLQSVPRDQIRHAMNHPSGR